MQKSQKSYLLTKEAALKDKKWFLIDASDKILGRVACAAASILRGKTKVTFTPHVDCGDYVLIVNAEKIKLSGKKLSQKVYFSHSGYPGGHRLALAQDVLKKHPDRILTSAVSGMLPKGRLGRAMLKKLKVVAGETHHFAAQKPEKIEV
ncbi:MAG: 50S ribosomal protein L13 [Candidatus Margulisiibacteriota bacterium]